MLGIYTRLRKYSKNLTELFLSEYHKSKRVDKSFVFNKKKYNYFIHPYNYTWSNERCVEIPLVLKLIKENTDKEILELGNVMSHYVNIKHDVLDKYEKGKGVTNEDVVSFKSRKKYDLIIAISTLEHVGWDEKNIDTKKIFGAIKNLKKLLKKGGTIFITHPLGYNFYMDEYLKQGKIKLTENYLLERINKENIWKQTEWKKQIIRYNYPFPYTNGLLIGIIKK